MVLQQMCLLGLFLTCINLVAILVTVMKILNPCLGQDLFFTQLQALLSAVHDNFLILLMCALCLFPIS